LIVGEKDKKENTCHFLNIAASAVAQLLRQIMDFRRNGESQSTSSVDIAQFKREASI